MKWVALFSAVTLAGCGFKGGNDQRNVYLSEIRNGVERVFPEHPASGWSAEGSANQHFVSPSGLPTNDGTVGRPWDLRTALSHPKAVKPGDIIWLRAGTYSGAFTSDLIGRSGSPIIVRQYPGERAKIDGCSDTSGANPVLAIQGEYTWYWGFEVAGCAERRPQPAMNSASVRASGIDLKGTDVKLINLVIHDLPAGIYARTSAKRAELSGNIVYYNGWDGPDHGYGDGIYVQNDLGMKIVDQNIVFYQFGAGIHGSSDNASPTNLILDGNLMFSNGALSSRPALRHNILVGGEHPVMKLTVSGNSTYAPLSGGATNLLGRSPGCNKVVVKDNYFAGAEALQMNECTDADIRGNAFVGATGGFQPFVFRDNEYRNKPTVRAIEVRANPWEEGRGYVAIYNWEKNPRLVVDVARLGWKVGQKYRLRNVENYFDDIMTGVYDGESVEIPMTGWKVAAPAGSPPPASTFPEFGAFVIETDDFPISSKRPDAVQVSAAPR